MAGYRTLPWAVLVGGRGQPLGPGAVGVVSEL